MTLRFRANEVLARMGLVFTDADGALQNASPSTPVPVNGTGLLDVARGLIAGEEVFNKFGRNSDIDTGSLPEDVWGGGSTYTGFPTGSAETIDVSSSSALDNGVTPNTGLRSVRLFGQLNGVEQTEDVILNGVANVTTNKTWTRMNRVRGLTAGAGGSNAGVITCKHTTTTANVFATVPVGTNRSQIACFTVPAGKSFYLKVFDPRLILSGGVAASATVVIAIREPGSVWEYTSTLDLTTGGPAPLPVDMALVYPALTDICLRVTGASSSNLSVTGQFFGIMVDD